ncbi:helix-turn-helix domain-containing protein [Listeria ilorinensis]|uniref:helix-turn-helix domain-containing protein n=1 Tax=Listeria ilorinensis TaxID=2867439 RepID=UPI001EF69563|nr:AraC family transcriptional regulator [Listeria ilorinensis]
MSKSSIFQKTNIFETLQDYDCFLTDESKIKQLIERFKQDQSEISTALICQNSGGELTYRVPFVRILYVLQGTIRITIDAKLVEYSAGCFIIASPATEIFYSELEDDTEVMTLLFKKDFFDLVLVNQLADYPLFYDFIHYVMTEKEQKSNYFFFACKPEDDTRYLALILLKEILSHKKNSPYKVVRAAFLLLIAELDRLKDISLILKESVVSSNMLVGEILKYIQLHYDVVTLQHLSDIFGLHPNYLSGLIKENTGKLFSQHLAEVRLEKAVYLLLNTNLSISKISEMLGYMDKGYFFKLFKKHFQMSPRKYRLAYQKEVQPPQ